MVYVWPSTIDVLTETLGARGLTIEEVWAGGTEVVDPERGKRLVDAMPSADVAVSIKAEYHRDPTVPVAAKPHLRHRRPQSGAS